MTRERVLHVIAGLAAIGAAIGDQLAAVPGGKWVGLAIMVLVRLDVILNKKAPPAPPGP